MSVVETITNPVFIDDSGTRVDCLVKFDTIDVVIPFTANKNDVEEYGRAIYAALIAGNYGPIAAYVPPEQGTNNNGS